jgi:hypothetical protein
MLRTLLGVIVLLALPALLNAQAPSRSNAPGRSGMSHGIATQVQGDAVTTDEPNGPNNQEGLDEKDGKNDDGDVEQGGVDDHGDVNVDEHEDVNNDVGDQAGKDEGGQDEGSTPAPAQSRFGHHKP